MKKPDPSPGLSRSPRPPRPHRPHRSPAGGARGRDEAVVLSAIIDELAPGGDGVAIVEIAGARRAVFVRHAAVGDHVKLAVGTEVCVQLLTTVIEVEPLTDWPLATPVPDTVNGPELV